MLLLREQREARSIPTHGNIAQRAAAAASCAATGVGLENTEANQRIKSGGVRAEHERDATCEEYLAKLVNPEIFYLKYLPAGLFFLLFWVFFFSAKAG